MTKLRIGSAKQLSSKTAELQPDYPLQGSKLDIPLSNLLSFPAPQRRKWILDLLAALGREIKADRMALKNRVAFKKEMRDLRALLYAPADKYLYTDDRTRKRNVLGKGSPGGAHTYWSRHQMWKMKTKGGDLSDMILKRAPSLISTLEKLFDPEHESKKQFRNQQHTAVRNALSYLQFDKGSGTAFPPFHARFFADRFLPKEGDGIVVDPCAGWGGRLLGTLCVKRAGHIQYFGVDPEKRNKPAYEGLERRVNKWMEKELFGKRTARIFYRPFEDWIKSASARNLCGKSDLVITSPPYFSAENYNPSNKRQSANRYNNYETWREKFYRKLIAGAYSLLKPGGVFVLNIADVRDAPKLERDARALARECGFENAGFYKLAMSINPGTRKGNTVRHAVWVNGVRFKHEPVFCFRKPLPSSAEAASPKTTGQSAHPLGMPQPIAVSAFITDLNALTPVELRDGIYLKRDDLFRPFPDMGVSGGKVRQCIRLVEKNLRLIKEAHGGMIATACSVHSPQGLIVARVAKKFGLKCLIGVGTAKPMKHLMPKQCKELGAEIVTLSRTFAYTAVLESRLDQLNNRRKLYPIRFGYQAKTDRDAVIEPISRQVRNIPRTVTALVVPVGSGVSAQGILDGVKKFRPELKLFLIQPFGYQREIRYPDGLEVHYLKGKHEYAKPMARAVGGVHLDQIYEAKAFDVMEKELTREFRGETVCFWLIGNANGMRVK